MSLDIEVRDYAGNLTTASKPFTVNPTGGGTYPVVQFTCPTDGAYLPSAYAGLLLTATASDSAGISRIAFYRPGDTTPFFTSTPASGTPSPYSGTSTAVTLPTVAGDTVVRYRARRVQPGEPLHGGLRRRPRSPDGRHRDGDGDGRRRPAHRHARPRHAEDVRRPHRPARRDDHAHGRDGSRRRAFHEPDGERAVLRRVRWIDRRVGARVRVGDDVSRGDVGSGLVRREPRGGEREQRKLAERVDVRERVPAAGGGCGSRCRRSGWRHREGDGRDADAGRGDQGERGPVEPRWGRRVGVGDGRELSGGAGRSRRGAASSSTRRAEAARSRSSTRAARAAC